MSVGGCGGAGPQIRSTTEELQMEKGLDPEMTQNRRGDNKMGFIKKMYLIYFLTILLHTSQASFTTNIIYSSSLCRPLSLH